MPIEKNIIKAALTPANSCGVSFLFLESFNLSPYNLFCYNLNKKGLKIKKKLLVFLLFFSGCFIKKDIKLDLLYQKILTHTKRGKITNFKTKALIDGIYLNQLYNNFKNTTFLIGVYNDFNNTLINKEFNLTLNNQIPIKISKKIPNFIPYKKFPFYNKWMNYYLVEFRKIKQPFILTYKSKQWGVINLTF